MRIWQRVNENPHSSLHVLVQKQNVGMWENSILLYFHVDIVTFKTFQIIFTIEYQHTSTVEHC